MPWAQVGGAIIGGLLSGSNRGSAPGVSPVAQLPNQAQMGGNLYGATTGYLGQAGQYSGMNPQYANQAFNAMYNNPYAGAMQGSANQAGAMAGQFAPMAFDAGMGSMAAGRQALGAGQQIWQTALDPQQALFNQMQNQVGQQANVTNSQYGLGASGAGAGLANQAMGSFDINWQNQQLGRQLQGQQALNAGIGVYGGATQAGLGFGREGIGLQQEAGMLPYQAAQNIAQNQFGAIGQNQAAMQGALQPYQQNINNMLAYTGAGQAGQAQANQQAYQQQMLQRQNAAGLGQLGAGVLSAWSGGGGGGGGGGWPWSSPNYGGDQLTTV